MKEFKKIPTFDLLPFTNNVEKKNLEERHIIGRLTKTEYDEIYANKKDGKLDIRLFGNKLSLLSFKLVAKHSIDDIYTDEDKAQLNRILLLDRDTAPRYILPTELNYKTLELRIYQFGHKISDCFNAIDILKYKLAQLNNPKYFIIFKVPENRVKSILLNNKLESK